MVLLYTVKVWVAVCSTGIHCEGVGCCLWYYYTLRMCGVLFVVILYTVKVWVAVCGTIIHCEGVGCCLWYYYTL